MYKKTHSEIKVSVIVPVWNPGPGISRCIESLRNQTLTDIEMIFVDDCGTDDSMNKVRAAAAEDTRIRILKNNSNIGSGASRNRGIDLAKGEYLSFVDADDWVAKDFLELLFLEAKRESFDIIKGSKAKEEPDGGYIIDSNMNQLIRMSLALDEPLYTSFVGEHWTAIYRRGFVKEKNIRYGSSLIGEDVTFLLKACRQADSFSIADVACYVFCRRANSATQTRGLSYLEAQLQSIREKVDYALCSIPEDSYLYAYLKMRFHLAINEGGRFFNDSMAKAALDNYKGALRKELLRLKNQKKITKDDFILFALREYGCLLPLKPYALGNEAVAVRHARLIQKWVDFLLTHPNDTNNCWKELKPLIIRANKAMKNNVDKHEDRKQGHKHFIAQVKRLPWRFRIHLILLKIESLLHRSIKKELKRG